MTIYGYRIPMGFALIMWFALWEIFGQLGVSTLELDIQITKDGYAVVTHDRRINPAKCADTAPVTPGDPQFPYAQGKYIKDLTLAQVRTIDCGSLRQAQFPEQELHPGESKALLSEGLRQVDSTLAEDIDLLRRMLEA